MIAIGGIRYRSYTHYTLYRSCLPIYGIGIIKSLSFLSFADFEGNVDISLTVKSGSTVSSICNLHGITISMMDMFLQFINDMKEWPDVLRAVTMVVTVVNKCSLTMLPILQGWWVTACMKYSIAGEQSLELRVLSCCGGPPIEAVRYCRAWTSSYF